MEHGRIEVRRIQVSVELNGYSTFPHMEQVFRIRRKRTEIRNGVELRTSEEVAYGVTSLTPKEASPGKLLELVRGHWQIENGLHWVRDVAFDEDRCQIRRGGGARAFASLRNFAIGVLGLNGEGSISQEMRLCAWNRERALSMIGA